MITCTYNVHVYTCMYMYIHLYTVTVVSSYKKSWNYVTFIYGIRIMLGVLRMFLFLLKHEIIVFCGLYKYYTILNV